MKKIAFSSLGALAAMAVPAVAQAQSSDDGAIEPYVGVTAGYHDIGTAPKGNDGAIFGVVAGVDVPVGETFFVGAEGNFNIGTGAIDQEYGGAARFGVKLNDNAKVYVRGGYQEVKYDLSGLAFIAPPPESFGDYLVGAGAEFGIGNSPFKIRVGVDTIGFDTTRATGGLVFGF
jgi:opacity protein-like surface antigen